MPVGIVVVSHSAALANDVVALVAALANLSPDDVPLVAAGGLNPTTLGTDAARIAAAIEQADQGDGVLVVAALGSAVLSALSAVEDLLTAQHAFSKMAIWKSTTAPANEPLGTSRWDEATGRSSAAIMAAEQQQF